MIRYGFLLIVLRVFLCCLPLWSGQSVRAETNDPGIKIVTSFYPVYITTLNIAGGIPGVTLTSMTQPLTGCLHAYQLTPADIAGLSEADIFVINGAGMESFLEKTVAQLPRLKIINASEGIELIKGEHEVNPHVWLSITNAMRQVANITRGLAVSDPAHADGYRRNAGIYLRKLAGLEAELQDGLKDIRRRDIITLHDAFPYFAREYNLRVVTVIEKEPGSEPGARDLAEITDIIRKEGYRVLFVEPQSSRKSAETIARETGVTISVLDPVVTGPMVPDAYLTIMQQNLRQLRKALK